MIITITYSAKCNDCIFIERYRLGKLIRHRCINQESKRYNQNISKKNLVCENCKLLKD